MDTQNKFLSYNEECMECQLEEETAQLPNLKEELESKMAQINILQLEIEVIKADHYAKENKQQQVEEEWKRRQEALARGRERLIVELNGAKEALKQKDLMNEYWYSALMEKEEQNSQTESALEETNKQLEEMKELNSLLKDESIKLKENMNLQKATCMSLESVLAESAITKREVLESVSYVFENELQCSICNELFICAVILNCSHTFCKSCIDQWKKSKRNCPNCRSFITSETRVLVLDNFIEKVVPNLPDDLVKSRAKVVQERKAPLYRKS
ncbi:hypothetical protein Pcinc_034084 [Petrolisthes cinctipes]|uniref:RING-type domain-containing protein n=1 Tax=Petrolisthes cinctipes TaxID=88211 RepID=A0AAE1ER03_PETCI|nr:hypothetical protein Pcinc_034084 [Petrolisthes cinctipes]